MDQSPTSVVAVATTLHLCLAALRNHRQHPTGISPLAVVSVAMSALPWIFPTAAGLAAGLIFHALWFGACEWLARPRAADTSSFPRPVPPVAEAAARPAQTRGFRAVPVIATYDETADIKTIRLLRPESFEFTAGQFLTVRLNIDGREYARCYSISSAPGARGYLEISVKRQGVVSSALHASVRPGGTLQVRAPAGSFTYPSRDDRPILLLAAGVGITPLMSMLRHACATEPTRPVTLIYGVRTEQDLAFRDELSSIARRHPQVRVYIAVSRGATQPHLYPGRIDHALIAAAMPAVRDALAFICGPGDMIGATRTLLEQRGMPPAQIRSEQFEAAIAASAAADRAPAQGAPATHALTCARSGRRVSAQAGQTILEAAESGGVEVESLCRAGVCGTCRLQVTEGDAHCASTVLDEHDRAAGYVLACVTTLNSDCTVDL